MISVFFNDNSNSLTLKNLNLDFDQCYKLFSDIMRIKDNSLGIFLDEKTIQFYNEGNNKILVEIINKPSFLNPQMFATFDDSLNIIKDIYEKNSISILPQMKFVDITSESLEEVLNKK
jgi:hypothetical protein